MLWGGPWCEWGQQSVPSLLLLRLFRSWSKGCGEEKVLSVSLWCPTLGGGECQACLCHFSVKFLCGEEIPSRWMEGFQTQLGLGEGREGRHMHPEICFCYGRGVGKPLLPSGEQMLIPSPCLPLILHSAGRSSYGIEAVGSLRTSSSGSCSSCALVRLPPADSTPCETELGWPYPPAAAPGLWDAGRVHALEAELSHKELSHSVWGDIPPHRVLRPSDSCASNCLWRLLWNLILL